MFSVLGKVVRSGRGNYFSVIVSQCSSFFLYTYYTKVVNFLFVHVVFQYALKENNPKNLWRRKHRKFIGCLDIHLKIVFETYQGIVSDVNFATFFVLNAKELELMTFHVERIDEEFIARQERLLQLDKKASKGARFHFTTDRCLRDIGDISDVRDLDLADPFVR
jgi:hypothetical protein